MQQTPAQLGFMTPAEWDKHSAVWLAWPHDPITFPDRVDKAEDTMVKIISALHPDEDIELLVLDETMKTKAEQMLTDAGVDLKKVSFHITDYADVWLRDYGPMFVRDNKTRELAWVKWNYDAYSKKFPDLLKDNEVFFNLRRAIDKRMFEPGMVLEGGSIEVNGQGTLITTEQSLLNSGRNPGLSKADIEKTLKDNLGVSHIIWLKEGITNDHTDGHVDDVAKFVAPNKVMLAYEDNPSDENYKILEENYQILLKSTDQDGKALEIIKLPMPHMKYDDGSKAPVSYANFYIGNETILVPTYNDPNDQKALDIIQSHFENRKVVGIDCPDVIYGGGAIHCMTQQQPA